MKADKIGELKLIIKLKFKIDVSMWDIIKLRIMRADYAKRIMNHIINKIEETIEETNAP